MVAVLLLPIVLLLATCLLDRLERRVVSAPPATRTPVAHPATGVDEETGADEETGTDGPIAPVVPLRQGPSLDADTVRLQRAS